MPPNISREEFQELKRKVDQILQALVGDLGDGEGVMAQVKDLREFKRDHTELHARAQDSKQKWALALVTVSLANVAQLIFIIYTLVGVGK